MRSAAHLLAGGGKQVGNGIKALRVARHDKPLQAMQQVLFAIAAAGEHGYWTWAGAGVGLLPLQAHLPRKPLQTKPQESRAPALT